MRAAVLLGLIFIIAFSNAVSLPFKVDSVHVEMPHHVLRGGGDSKCKDEFRKKCGKEVDALKKAIENTSVMGIIKGSVDVASCVLNNLEDLFNHCKLTSESSGAAVTMRDSVVLQGKSAIASFEQMTSLNNERFYSIASDSNCKKQWEKDCGKEVDKLKKAVEDTSIMGIVSGAAGVVECAFKNLEDIYNHCKPGNEDDPIVMEVAPIPGNLGPVDQVNMCVGVVQSYCGAQLNAIRALDMSATFEAQVDLFKNLEVCIESNMKSIESECQAASHWEFPQADVHSGCRHPRFSKHALVKIPLLILFVFLTVFTLKRCVRVLRGGKGCHGCCHSAPPAKVVSVASSPVALASVDEVEKGQVYQPLVDQEEKKDAN